MILYGASGHAKVICSILESKDIAIQGIFDDNTSITKLDEYLSLGKYDSNLYSNENLIISIGDNKIRMEVAKKIKTEFGPQLGYVLDGKLSAKEGDDDFIESAGPIITKMESQFDIGVILGLGYELTDNFDLTARFYSGIIEKDNIINLGISLRVE
jgi:hypothetical protein